MKKAALKGPSWIKVGSLSSHGVTAAQGDHAAWGGGEGQIRRRRPKDVEKRVRVMSALAQIAEAWRLHEAGALTLEEYSEMDLRIAFEVR